MTPQIREKIERALAENDMETAPIVDCKHMEDGVPCMNCIFESDAKSRQKLQRIARAVIPLVEALTEIADLGTAEEPDIVPTDHHVAMRVVNSARAHLALAAFEKEIDL